MIYADASFVVALVVKGDDHWQPAWKWWSLNHAQPLYVSRLTLFEAENTIRALAVAGKCRSSESRQAIEGLRRALLDGILIQRSVPENRLFPSAARLSQHYTVNATFGALDILHVAIALELGCVLFLSFDVRQRELASKEGLQVQP